MGAGSVSPRPAKVEVLVQRALVAMEDPDTSGAEVISACLTLALRALHASLVLGGDPGELREACLRLLAETAEPTVQ